jgi:uncharacterized protein
MGLETLEAVFRKVFPSSVCGNRFAVIWHAGEPLVMGLRFYREAFELIDGLTPNDCAVSHAIQSNGLLLNDAWCDLIHDRQIALGVSLDGPASLHDMHRTTIDGRGTHSRVMKSVRLLQDRGIDFSVISVITADTLDRPDEFFEFFLDAGIQQIGLSVAQIEGVNLESTMSGSGANERFRAFIARLYELVRVHPEMRIQQFTDMEQLISKSSGPSREQAPLFDILGIDHLGNISAFGTGLLAGSSPAYGRFIFGNVFTDDLDDVLIDEKFRRVARDITEGVNLCRESCKYFSVCGGGAPSNKVYEHGTFACTETTHCRLNVQAVYDVVAKKTRTHGHTAKGHVGDASGHSVEG